MAPFLKSYNAGDTQRGILTIFIMRWGVEKNKTLLYYISVTWQPDSQQNIFSPSLVKDLPKVTKLRSLNWELASVENHRLSLIFTKIY